MNSKRKIAKVLWGLYLASIRVRRSAKGLMEFDARGPDGGNNENEFSACWEKHRKHQRLLHDAKKNLLASNFDVPDQWLALKAPRPLLSPHGHKRRARKWVVDFGQEAPLETFDTVVREILAACYRVKLEAEVGPKPRKRKGMSVDEADKLASTLTTQTTKVAPYVF